MILDIHEKSINYLVIACIMSISTKFENFCSKIRIPTSVAEDISYRYKRITKQLNKDYWDTESDTSHSLYVGSYGRDTDIHTSDVDMLFQLPSSVYDRIDKNNGNGQSALLQEVRNSIQKTYPTTYTSGDGQIVKLNFEDGVGFEILPCFLNTSNTFTYPDANAGGKWKTTDPRPEIEAIKKANDKWNGNLKNLCRMARAWKDEWSVPMSGLLIDTLAYNFLKDWSYSDKSFVYYDYMTRDFLKYVKDQDPNKSYWLAPGSNKFVHRTGKFEYRALACYNIAVEAINYEESEASYSADLKWREIYGSKF